MQRFARCCTDMPLSHVRPLSLLWPFFNVLHISQVMLLSPSRHHSRMKKLLPLLVVLSLAACTAQVTPTDSAASSSVPRLGSMVQYGELNGKTLNGYLAVPASEGPHPALVLIHEWWGLNDNIKDYAEKFADEGYVALAVDMYDGKVTTDQAEAGQWAGAVRGDIDAAMANLQTAVDYLKSRADVDDAKLGSVGWCFGGGWSYQMAKNDLGMKATVMYYGQFDAEHDFEHMKSTILGHFGEEDANIKVDDVREFQAALQTASGTHEVYIYPNAGHGFANDNNTQAYNPEAAKQAWQRTLSFLQRVMPQ